MIYIIMEISIRLMLVIVVSIVAILVLIMMIFGMGGESFGAFEGLVDWITGMMK